MYQDTGLAPVFLRLVGISTPTIINRARYSAGFFIGNSIAGMLKSYAWLIAIIPDGLKLFWAMVELIAPKTTKDTRRSSKSSLHIFYSKKRGWVIDLKWDYEISQEEHRD